MVGAPLLAARAASRLGAGKVQVGFAAAHFPSVDTTNLELMLHSAGAVFDGASALVIGPGLGRSDDAREVLMRAIASTLPAVFDADALNIISVDSRARAALASRSAATLITPHPAEAARLLGTDTAAITRDRLGAALTLAQQLNAHVVVKGAGSVLAHPDHDWDINASGNPGLASAGTGDVLSGMLGALLAQRIDSKTTLRLGVCLHGAAADALVAGGNGPLGLPASDVADAARTLLNQASRQS
jgi:ADP-dependent NAD(P)H-hydrate dehydratase / NAD(P)H-hydrate epimerase